MYNNQKRLQNRIFLALMTVFLVFFIPRLAEAQTGSVYGEVVDQNTGETLPGATVMIEGTNYGAATDIDGRFLLRRIPVGEYVVRVSYLGFDTQEFNVTVIEDEGTELNVQLRDMHIMGDDIIVEARQRGQARAMTRQRQSVNIRNIVSSEQIDAFADQTVSGALQRVVGMGHGGANIRGVGAGASNITMDGQRMGSTSQDRQVDLNTISADMVQELDVIKVVTPDMDADAMSGVINVSTRRPIGGDRNMNVRLGGGFQDRYYRHTGGAARAAFSYGDSPSDNFTYGFNLSYQRSPSASEMINMNWAGRTWDDVGRVDVLGDLINEVRFDVRDRYAAGFQMTFQPTHRSTFHVQSMFNYQERWDSRHGVRYNITVDRYTNPFRTGPMPGNQSNMYFDPRLDESNTNQYTVQLGGRHLLSLFDMEYIVGWGHGRHHDDSYRFAVRTPSRFDFLVNIEDRTNPQVDIAEDSSEWQTYPGASRIQFTNMDHRVGRHQDNEFTNKLDFQAPHELGAIKFGASALLSFRKGEGERFNGAYDRRLNADEFNLIPNAEWRIFDRDHMSYRVPWMIDLNQARDLYYGHRPHFDSSLDTWFLEVETTQYRANEHTFGTYLMGDITFGRFKMLGGARVEHTMNFYRGREGSIGEEGRFRGAKDIESSNNYTNIFPNAQVVTALSSMTNVRMAFSRTIGRPTFRELSPNVMRNYSNETIRQGNPDLKPMLSNNLDFIVEHYFMNVGQVSLGLFFKDMKDFVYQDESIIRGGPQDDEQIDDNDEMIYEGWRRITFANGDEATVYGLEFSWQQSLSFLPGFLGRMSVYSNYAYTQSFADIGRRHPDPRRSEEEIYVPLRDMRPHVVNAGVGYTQGRFDTQFSYQWGAPSISSYGQAQWVPQIHQRHREYFDAYRDAASDLSMTARFRISSAFRVWMDASNILNQRRIDYNFDRDYYPRAISLSGRRVNIGLRYTF